MSHTNTGFALTGLRRIGLDLPGLCRAIGLVFRILSPIVLITAVLSGIVYGFYLDNPKMTQLYRTLTVDNFVVLEQLRRAAAVPAPDLAFVGDSSCLMGVDVSTLRSRLPDKAIESFCTLAYVGPAGYAQMIQTMINRGAAPRKLVIVLHPIQFDRQPSWDSWVAVIEQGGLPQGGRDLGFPLAAFDHARFAWLATIAYQPLPGAYGAYYGSAAAFIDTIRASHGSAVDPGTGLNFNSLAELDAYAAIDHNPSRSPISYPTSPAFQQALGSLANLVRQLGPENVFLLISPVPGTTTSGDVANETREIARGIASRLALPSEHLLHTSPELPDPYFASSTHLNRWGRIRFSSELARALKGRL